MQKLQRLKSPLQILQPGLQSKHHPQAQADGPRKPWAKDPLAPARLSGRALQKRNHLIKVRDMFICAGCHHIFLPDELDVDHRIPLAQGGSETEDNLQLLCNAVGGCHEKKTKAENAEFAASRAKP